LTSAGPLAGISVIEFEAIGPVPFACAHLADLGAVITRIARPGGRRNTLPEAFAATTAATGSVESLDLKTASGRNGALGLLESADVLIEGFRPGTMERLGLGPNEVMALNPAIVYARVTGWGQTGPYSSMAGHDINYIGLAGALDAIGPTDQPIPPLNLVGDYGGGSMFAVSGILAALVERASTGSGSVIDVAMVDGAGALLAPIRAMLEAGVWMDGRERNLLDGGAPFYRTYQTSDGRFVAVGALEPAFYDELIDGLGLDRAALPDRHNPANWSRLAEVFSGVFASHTAAHWSETFDGTDACVTPVLSMREVMDHPHNRSRGALIDQNGHIRPRPAPRFNQS
jgi:alpha-methylacyl-CoA racemase